MSDTQPISTARKSGSQKRRRKNVVNITFDDLEFAVTQAKANAAGLSLASLGRAAILGNPGPRARRVPPINAELMGYAVGQLNRVGNNLNQIAYRLNAAQALGAQDFTAAAEETRAAVRLICKSLGLE